TAHHVGQRQKHWAFRHETVADRFGLDGYPGWYGGVRGRAPPVPAALALCRAWFVRLAPHALDAFAILWAQDEPSELADVRLNSALRNTPSLIAENIEAALAAEDADLANSFVELARDRNIALNEELSKRVSEAVAEANSTSHFAR